MTLGVKPPNFAVLGGQMGSNEGQLGAVTRILIFEPGRHMMGVLALFFVAGFIHGPDWHFLDFLGFFRDHWGSAGGQSGVQM